MKMYGFIMLVLNSFERKLRSRRDGAYEVLRLTKRMRAVVEYARFRVKKKSKLTN